MNLKLRKGWAKFVDEWALTLAFPPNKIELIELKEEIYKFIRRL